MLMKTIVTKFALLSLFTVAAVFTSTAMADHAGIKPKPYDSLGKCVKAALSKHDGKIVKVELKSENKKSV